MSITVVGSLAYDSVKTPFGERERMLGGAATHFALAASFFEHVRVVGPVGADFTKADMALLGTRGTDTSNVDLVADGQTMFWRGEYSWDLNSRETLETQLNVFEQFEPNLNRFACSSDVLFLANIVPALQGSVLDQCTGPRWTALDSMNLWIDVARDDLLAVIRRVDCVILNDAEVRQLTGKASIVDAARKVLGMGPSAVIAKQGEYGAVLVTEAGFSSLPAFPLERVVDPTGAGDTFAGGVVGFVAAHPDEPVDHDLLTTAMAYGTAAASFNVEGFGTERMLEVTSAEIESRVSELAEITSFEQRRVELRA